MNEGDNRNDIQKTSYLQDAHFVLDMDSVSVLDWLEWVLGTLLSVLERGLKAEFIALMEPLMNLALLLNPLPQYQLTQDIRDGDQPMRWAEVKSSMAFLSSCCTWAHLH